MSCRTAIFIDQGIQAESRQLPTHALPSARNSAPLVGTSNSSERHHLANVFTERSSSHYSKVWPGYQRAFPNNPVAFGSQPVPPCILPTPDVHCKSPGIHKKSDVSRSAFQEYALSEIFHIHVYRSQIYTMARRVLPAPEQRSSSRSTTCHSVFS